MGHTRAMTTLKDAVGRLSRPATLTAPATNLVVAMGLVGSGAGGIGTVHVAYPAYRAPDRGDLVEAGPVEGGPVGAAPPSYRLQ